MSKNGMAGGLSNRNFRTNLSYLPDAKKLHTIDFPLLNGGLNLYDLDYRMSANESPDMKNLRWIDGALGSRHGQYRLVEQPSPAQVGYAAYDDFFWGYAFFHIGSTICCCKIDDPDDPDNPRAYTTLKTGVPTNRGTFFRYGEYLMYKNSGGYYRIGYNAAGATIVAKFPVSVPADDEFIPVTYINTNPTTIAGTAYQPENRLSKAKTIWYSAEAGIDKYYLPYGSGSNVIDAVTKVVVNGLTMALTTDYSVTIDSVNEVAYVKFTTPPAVPNPFVPNTVQITYTTTGTDAYNAVMGCPYAIVYGGDQNLCVVVGGCSAQPNAYFWSGNDQVSMNPFYFPMEQYNFAGDTENAVMGFGKQQGFLVIFSKKCVGKASFGTTTTSSDRLAIEMPYTAINSKYGCDFPWSIRLVDNNLVFVNQENGVCFVSDSSAAHENNIIEIGKKIGGNDRRHGLLYDVFVSGADGVFSTVFEDKYWVVANEHAYVWDFRLSTYENPSWFFFTNIYGVAFLSHAEVLYHLDAKAGVSDFRNNFSDYDQPIDKVYQFATQNMGTYDRLKNVMSVVFAVRSDTDTTTNIKYMTDYEDRYDLTPIRSMSWQLVPRNLAFRYLGVQRYAVVQRRRPECRHVRHFTMRLENNILGQDLSIISAQLQFNYQGRQM